MQNKTVNRVNLTIFVEPGCSLEEGEYKLTLHSSLEGLDINASGGVDDISLIKDCIENNIESLPNVTEGYIGIVVEEDGEQEDVFFNKYYTIISAEAWENKFDHIELSGDR